MNSDPNGEILRNSEQKISEIPLPLYLLIRILVFQCPYFLHKVPESQDVHLQVTVVKVLKKMLAQSVQNYSHEGAVQ